MRWIKASERKPVVKDNQRVPVRMFGIYDTILFTNGWWCWLRGEQVNDVRVRSEDWEDVEWLDESTPEGVSAEAEKQKKDRAELMAYNAQVTIDAQADCVKMLEQLDSKDEEIARLKEDVKELVEGLQFWEDSYGNISECRTNGMQLIQKHKL